MHLRIPALVLAGLAAVPLAHALPFDDWSLMASGGRYYLPDETPYEWTYDPLCNPYFAAHVHINGESAVLDSKQFNVPVFPVFAPDGTELIFEASGFTIGLQRQLALHRGDTITGYAKLWTEDYPEYSDHAQVTINGTYAWYHDLSTTWRAAGEYDGLWQQWTYTAPTTGLYTIGVSIYGDDELDSVASFRDISILARVPDVSTTAGLLGIGLVSLGYLRRRLRR